MKIECPICPIVKKGIINYFTDLRFIRTPEFKTKAYNKHLFWSLVLTIPSMFLLFLLTDLETTQILWQVFVAGFGAYSVNFVREWVRGKFFGSEWDNVDINMGSYGGVLGGIISVIIYKLI